MIFFPFSMTSKKACSANFAASFVLGGLSGEPSGRTRESGWASGSYENSPVSLSMWGWKEGCHTGYATYLQQTASKNLTRHQSSQYTSACEAPALTLEFFLLVFPLLILSVFLDLDSSRASICRLRSWTTGMCFPRIFSRGECGIVWKK